MQIQKNKMKRTILILLTALLSTAPMMAQYSPCYEAAFAEGKRLYNTGQYTQANKYFNEAKGCPDPNEAEVNDMIGKCNKKIKEIKRAEAEKAAFEKCNSVEACEKYLEDYPNGNYVSVVNDKLLKLVEVEKVERESHSKEMNTELISGHAYVDLGLPSGTLWATCNVGASKPEDYGDYFAWGETEPKSTYNWSTYKYANGDYNKLTKYCNDSDLGYNSFTDNLTTLEASDDAATANWGSDWCMPSDDQWIELMDNTSITLTTINRVYGLLFTASNGHSLFLPAAGYHWGDAFNYDGDLGYYWSSSLNTDNSSGTMYFNFNFNSGNYSMKCSYRLDGRSVRAVLRSAPEGTVGTGLKAKEEMKAERISGHEYVDLDLPSGTLWATCNVGASKPEGYGNYYAWGETSTKSTYNIETYKYIDNSYNTTKYSYMPSYVYNGFTDNLTTLEPSDDAATANIGIDWCIPTKEQWMELLENTTNKWTTQNGVKGMLFTAKNGQTLFLPAADLRLDDELADVGSSGFYWSSSLYTGSLGPIFAWFYKFSDDDYEVSLLSRDLGLSVRAVRSVRKK